MAQPLVLAEREGPSPPWQVPIIVHAFCCVLAFALFLPGGAILARYMRTFRPWWYTGHWIMQFGFAGPLLAVGVSMAYLADHQMGGTPSDNHKRTGTVIFVLYLLQCLLGAVIHFFKPDGKRRPIQNYLHGVLGVVLLVLGMYQIHTGYDQEWPMYMGYGRLPNYVNILWIIWCIVVILVYGAGLWLLRKQYAQEASRRLPATHIVLGALEPQHQPDANSVTNSNK